MLIMLFTTGVYRIGYKNTTTNKAQRMDVLVMENLFYQRNITHKFDLKGSIRNRLVNTSGKEVSCKKRKSKLDSYIMF